MLEIAKPAKLSLEDSLRSAIINVWDDFSAVALPRAVRIEYLSQPGENLTELTVWLVSAGGYQDRICDYRAGSSLDRPRVWQCWMRLRSSKLINAFNFIVRNQERFLRCSNPSHHGLIVVFPPTTEQRIEAADRAREIGLATSPPVKFRARAAS